MIYVDNLGRVDADFDAWLARVEEEATNKLREIATQALFWLSTHSPQYTGDFAANWKVKANGLDTSFDAGVITSKWTDPRGSAFGVNPYRQGDQAAIAYATGHGLSEIMQVKVGGYVTLANSAFHDEGYAWKIEGNLIKFRPENREGGRVIGRFVESFRSLSV